MPIRLPQDIKPLRTKCARQFGGQPTVEFAVGEILRRIDEEVWADPQGVPVATADMLNLELSPALDAVFAAQGTVKLLAAVDQLVLKWRDVTLRIVLA